MLRDASVVAADNVCLACENAAIAYEDAAAILRDEHSREAELFADLAAERWLLVHAFRDQIRAMGDLPSEHKPDRSTIAKLVRHAKAALLADETLGLIAERQEAEEALLASIAQALERKDDLPRPLYELLQEARDCVAKAQERLMHERSHLSRKSA